MKPPGMDYIEANRLMQKAQEQTQRAREYFEARRKSAEARIDLLILLTKELPEIRSKKANVGMDMAISMLCEVYPEAEQLRAVEIRETARYKGLEKLIDALQNEISYAQSVMKYVSKGEQFG